VTAAPPEDTPGKSRKTRLRQYYSLSALGIEMGVSLAVGLLIGWYLDRLFDTKPWLTIIFMVFGIIAGFRNIIRLARKDWDKEFSGERENDGD
jgi:ATP synthase protein I